MAIVSRKALKAFFQKGSKPTEEQFKSLVDSFVHQVEDAHRLGLTEFNKAKAYTKGTTVTFQGAIYQAASAVLPGSFNKSHWKKLQDMAVDQPGAEPGKGMAAPAVAKEVSGEEEAPSLKWLHFTLQHRQFHSQANEKNVALGAIPAKTVILGVLAKLTSSFRGDTITSYTLALGIKGDKEKLMDPLDVSQKPSSRPLKGKQVFVLGSWDKKVELTATASSTGDTLNTSTEGEAEIYVLTSLLP